jgi:hypothetical protein
MAITEVKFRTAMKLVSDPDNGYVPTVYFENSEGIEIMFGKDVLTTFDDGLPSIEIETEDSFQERARLEVQFEPDDENPMIVNIDRSMVEQILIRNFYILRN